MRLVFAVACLSGSTLALLGGGGCGRDPNAPAVDPSCGSICEKLRNMKHQDGRRCELGDPVEGTTCEQACNKYSMSSDVHRRHGIDTQCVAREETDTCEQAERCVK